MSLVYPTPNPATDKFVSTTASGSGNGAFATPWTFSQLMSASSGVLTPGTYVWLRAGTYVPPSVWTFVSGTSGNPITIAAYPSESVTLDCQTAVPTDRLGVQYECSYWDMWGINIKAGATGLSQTGYNYTPGHNCRWLMCSGTKNATGGDNCGIIFLQLNSSPAGNNSVIAGCTFTSNVTGGNNEALVYIDQISNFNVQGNLLTGSQLPIYQKHESNGTSVPSGYTRTISNNIIKNAELHCEFNMIDTQIFNNLFISSSMINDRNGGPTSNQEMQVYNNTFYNGTWSWYSASVNTIYRDNVLAGSSVSIRADNGPMSSIGLATNDYNQYSTSANMFMPSYSAVTFSQWKTANPTFDLHSQQANVTFVGTWSSSSVTPSDWVVTGPSSALTGSSTGGLRGVDTTALLTTNTPSYSAGTSQTVSLSGNSITSYLGTLSVTTPSQTAFLSGKRITSSFGSVTINNGVTAGFNKQWDIGLWDQGGLSHTSLSIYAISGYAIAGNTSVPTDRWDQSGQSIVMSFGTLSVINGIIATLSGNTITSGMGSLVVTTSPSATLSGMVATSRFGLLQVSVPYPSTVTLSGNVLTSSMGQLYPSKESIYRTPHFIEDVLAYLFKSAVTWDSYGTWDSGQVWDSTHI